MRPLVAGMATMPSRAETAPPAIASVLAQVDELWLFLDRFDAVPAYAEHPRIRVVGWQDVGDLRANGKLAMLFRTDTLRFDVRAWPDVNMVDFSFALEARRRGVPLVMLPRPAHWLRALDEDQADSIWAGVLCDDARQTELARELAALPRPGLPRRGWRRLSYREP